VAKQIKQQKHRQVGVGKVGVLNTDGHAIGTLGRIGDVARVAHRVGFLRTIVVRRGAIP
jgi:histidinol phosphatase-like PHP family hydrolase